MTNQVDYKEEDRPIKLEENTTRMLDLQLQTITISKNNLQEN